MTPINKSKAKKSYDFVTLDPKTGFMVEVKIVRYCHPDDEYEMPLAPETIAEIAVSRYKTKLIRYLYKK